VKDSHPEWGCPAEWRMAMEKLKKVIVVADPDDMDVVTRSNKQVAELCKRLQFQKYSKQHHDAIVEKVCCVLKDYFQTRISSLPYLWIPFPSADDCVPLRPHRQKNRVLTETHKLLAEDTGIPNAALFGPEGSPEFDGANGSEILSCQVHSLLCQLGDHVMELPKQSRLYQSIEEHFEATKFGGSKFPGARRLNSDTTITNSDLHIDKITCHVNQKLLTNFLDKMQRMAGSSNHDVRLVFGYHGTSKASRDMIVQKNFSLKSLGNSSGNQGWFGRGIYFARRAYTAFNYNKNSDGTLGTDLLVSLVCLGKVFFVPGPETEDNKYHGEEIRPGCSAHLSPWGKEFVVNNPRQILPCCILHLSRVPCVHELDDQEQGE